MTCQRLTQAGSRDDSRLVCANRNGETQSSQYGQRFNLSRRQSVFIYSHLYATTRYKSLTYRIPPRQSHKTVFMYLF